MKSLEHNRPPLIDTYSPQALIKDATKLDSKFKRLVTIKKYYAWTVINMWKWTKLTSIL